MTPGATFSTGGLLGGHRALAVDGLTQRVDDTTQQGLTHRHLENAPGGPHRVALVEVGVVAQHHRADRIALEVERHAVGIAGEFQHLALHDITDAVNAHDAVADADHRTFVARFGDGFEALDALFDQVTDFRGIELHLICPLSD